MAVLMPCMGIQFAYVLTYKLLYYNQAPKPIDPCPPPIVLQFMSIYGNNN